jgi:hypothetical protein
VATTSEKLRCFRACITRPGVSIFCQRITLISMKTTNEKQSFSPACNVPTGELLMRGYWISAG